jgi:hypothetical protein
VTEAAYWKLKAELLEAALLEEQARGVAQRAEFMRVRAFAGAGLRADRTYRLDDTRRRVIADPPKPSPTTNS